MAGLGRVTTMWPLRHTVTLFSGVVTCLTCATTTAAPTHLYGQPRTDNRRHCRVQPPHGNRPLSRSPFTPITRQHTDSPAIECRAAKRSRPHAAAAAGMLSSTARPAPPTARSSLDDGELDPWAASDDNGESSDPETIVARRQPASTAPIAEALDLDPALDPPDPAPRRTPSNLKLRGSPRIGGPTTSLSPALASASAPRTPASPAPSAPGALGKGVPRATSHPLALDELALGLRNGTLDGKIASLRLDERDDDDVSDVSRPNLRRLTSEMDRAVAESQGSSASASERGSVDLLRVAAEVEVIVHQVRLGRAVRWQAE